MSEFHIFYSSSRRMSCFVYHASGDKNMYAKL